MTLCCDVVNVLKTSEYKHVTAIFHIIQHQEALHVTILQPLWADHKTGCQLLSDSRDLLFTADLLVYLFDILCVRADVHHTAQWKPRL